MSTLEMPGKKLLHRLKVTSLRLDSILRTFSTSFAIPKAKSWSWRWASHLTLALFGFLVAMTVSLS